MVHFKYKLQTLSEGVIFDTYLSERLLNYILNNSDKILFTLDEIFHDDDDTLTIYYELINGDIYGTYMNVCIYGDTKSLKVYEEFIREKLTSKSSKIIYHKIKGSQFVLNKESSIEFITNLEDMLFNITFKPKSARK